MRYAQPHELTENVVPVLQLHLSAKQFAELFPVRTVALDPLSAPEPSKAALIQLRSGSYIVVTYGEITHRVIVEVAQSADAENVIRELLREVVVPAAAIEWKRKDLRNSFTNRRFAAERNANKSGKMAAKRVAKATAPKIKELRKKAEPKTRLAKAVLEKQLAKEITDARTALKDGLATMAKKLKKAAKAG